MPPSEDAETRKQRTDAAKQRHFAEQQRRLQEYGSHGGRKMNADTLIESILGKSESSRQPSHSLSKTAANGAPASESNTVMSSSSTIGL